MKTAVIALTAFLLVESASGRVPDHKPLPAYPKCLPLQAFIRRQLKVDQSDLHPTFLVDSWQFYKNQNPAELGWFVRWVKSQGHISEDVLKRGTRVSNIDTRFLEAFAHHSGLSMKELQFLEYLGPEEWRALDQRFTDDLRGRIRIQADKLKSLLEHIEARRISEKKYGRSVSFNGTNYDNAILLGVAHQGWVYRVDMEGFPAVIKVLHNDLIFQDVKQGYTLLQEAPPVRVIRLLGSSPQDNSLLLEYVHGLSYQDILQAEKDGVLAPGTVEAFEVFVRRHAVAVGKQFGKIFFDTKTDFYPHRENWIFDPATERLTLIDPS